MDWSLIGCWRSHVTYAPDEADLRSPLVTDTAVGAAWRCLRCGTFVVGEPHGSGPATDAPIVRRGRELRDAVVLRVLAVERTLRGLILGGAAYAVWTFRNEKHDIRSAFEANLPLLNPIADRLGWQLSDSVLIRDARHLLTISEHTLLLIALALTAYAAVELLEGVGLWLLKRWGEYFAVVATASFIPFEVYELAHRFTALKVVALVLNVAVVVYIIAAKRLFGVRGGAAAHAEERRSAAILELHQAADAR